jgi:hemerythrin superfamily protein
MSDVVELIEHDHREVEQLFAQFEQSGDAALAAQLCDELDKHAAAEEQEVYPVVAEKVDDGRKLASEAEDEHKEARQVIGRIRRTSDPEHLTELMQELKSLVQHHVQEEESEMLPKAQREISAEEREQLGARFEEAKQASE